MNEVFLPPWEDGVAAMDLEFFIHGKFHLARLLLILISGNTQEQLLKINSGNFVKHLTSAATFLRPGSLFGLAANLGLGAGG